MRLLVITQAVDPEDTYLGFFVGWLTEFAQQFGSIEVVCLKKGVATLPANVSVHSLGKEISRSRLRYIVRFYTYAWKLRHEYDGVFVHMNQEYVLLGALLWKLLGKRAYLWRNHGTGGPLTSLAVMLADKTFCTSRFSYIAKYKKNVLMPVGVDTDTFRPIPGVQRKARSILFFGRFAPSKQPDLLVEALAQLPGEWSASFVGSPLPKDGGYETRVRERVHQLGLENRITFSPGIPHRVAPELFSAHDVYVNLAASGMYDKTIFEAAACGCRVLAASEDFAAISPPSRLHQFDAHAIAKEIESMLAASADAQTRSREALITLAHQHSLKSLVARIREEYLDS